MLGVGGEAVLVLPEVLEGGEGVRPPDVEHELDPAREDEAAALGPALPRVLVRPVGHVQHVSHRLLVELVPGHELPAVLGRAGVVLVRQVTGDGVHVPGHVLVTHLTRVLHVLVDRDAEPRDLARLRLRLRHVLLVIFIQTQVMTSDMALQYFRVIYEVFVTKFLCYLYGTFIM